MYSYVPADMIKINGIYIPTPAGLEVTLSTLDQYSERNENTGKLEREILANKLKYGLSWKYISDQDRLNKLFVGISEYADFEIPNPNGNERYKFEGYRGDIGATMLSYWDMVREKARWKSLKVSIIER